MTALTVLALDKPTIESGSAEVRGTKPSASVTKPADPLEAS